MDPLQIFCRQVRRRSREHRQAIHLLSQERLSSPIIAILRQELDSMIRVIFLLSLKDTACRDELIKASVEGREWTTRTAKGKKRRITDREMAELANQLQGWTLSVYRFGCAFIHLSSFHDYHDRDPMAAISNDEKEAILRHMRYYHGGPIQPNPKFADLITYLPEVFDKIARNLECYVRDLETGGSIS
jgi:hypothetical protein